MANSKNSLVIRSKDEWQWGDLVGLGEVMLRVRSGRCARGHGAPVPVCGRARRVQRGARCALLRMKTAWWTRCRQRRGRLEIEDLIAAGRRDQSHVAVG